MSPAKNQSSKGKTTPGTGSSSESESSSQSSSPSRSASRSPSIKKVDSASKDERGKKSPNKTLEQGGKEFDIFFTDADHPLKVISEEKVNEITSDMLCDNTGSGDCCVLALLHSLQELEILPPEANAMTLRTRVITDSINRYKQDKHWRMPCGLGATEFFQQCYPQIGEPMELMVNQLKPSEWLDEMFIMMVGELYDINIVIYGSRPNGELFIMTNGKDSIRNTARIHNNGSNSIDNFESTSGTHFQHLPSSRAIKEVIVADTTVSDELRMDRYLAQIKSSSLYKEVGVQEQKTMINQFTSLKTLSLQRRVDHILRERPSLVELKRVEKTHGLLTGEMASLMQEVAAADLNIYSYVKESKEESALVRFKASMHIITRFRKLLMNFQNHSNKSIAPTTSKIEIIPLSGNKDSIPEAFLMSTCVDFSFESEIVNIIVFKALKYLLLTCVMLYAQIDDDFNAVSMSQSELEERVMEFGDDAKKFRNIDDERMSFEDMLGRSLDVPITSITITRTAVLKKENNIKVRTNVFTPVVIVHDGDNLSMINVRAVEKVITEAHWTEIYSRIQENWCVPYAVMKELTEREAQEKVKKGGFNRMRYVDVAKNATPARVLGFANMSGANSTARKPVRQEKTSSDLENQEIPSSKTKKRRRVQVEMMGYDLMSTSEQRSYLAKIRADITTRKLRGDLLDYDYEEIKIQLQELDSAIDRLDKDLDRISKDLKDSEVKHIHLNQIVMNPKLSTSNMFFQNWIESFLNKAYLERDWRLMVTPADRRHANAFYVANIIENVEIPLLHAIGSAKELAKSDDHLELIRKIQNYFHSSLTYQAKLLSELIDLRLHRNVNPNDKYNETVIMSVEALAAKNNCPTIELTTAYLIRNMNGELREHFNPIWERCKSSNGGVVDDITVYTTAVSNAWVEKDLLNRPRGNNDGERREDRRQRRDSPNERKKDNSGYQHRREGYYKREKEWPDRNAKRAPDPKVAVNFTEYVNTLGLDKEKASMLITKAESTFASKDSTEDHKEQGVKKENGYKSYYDHRSDKGKSYPKYRK